MINENAAISVIAVDDDATIRAILAAYFIKNAIPALVCADGAEMWGALAHCMPAVVLMDVEMPGEDGFTLAAQLRDRYAMDLAIIMLTSHGGPAHVRSGMVVGVDDYISKPVSLSRLGEVVAGYVHKITHDRYLRGLGAPKGHSVDEGRLGDCPTIANPEGSWMDTDF